MVFISFMGVVLAARNELGITCGFPLGEESKPRSPVARKKLASGKKQGLKHQYFIHTRC